MRTLKCLFILIVIFCFLPLFCQHNIKSLEIEKLNLILSLPSEENRIFMTIPFISIDGEKNIYAVDNRQHKVFRLDMKGRVTLELGRKGQGPGDLEWPYLITNYNSKVIIVDNSFISIFNYDGKFEHKFRIYNPVISMAVADNKIYLTEVQNDKIISAYDFAGKKITSFHQKYYLDYSIYKGFSKKAIDRFINDGKLISKNGMLFFISSLFGDFFIYDLEGQMIKIKEIKRNNFVDQNRKMYFKEGIINKGDGAFYHNKLLLDAYYCNGKIFVLLSSKAASYFGEDIWQIDEKTLQIDKKYVIFDKHNRDKMWPRNLIVTANGNNEYIFYISLYDSNDFLINIYK